MSSGSSYAIHGMLLVKHLAGSKALRHATVKGLVLRSFSTVKIDRADGHEGAQDLREQVIGPILIGPDGLQFFH